MTGDPARLLADEVAGHYNAGREQQRLFRHTNPLERERTREVLTHVLPPAPATVLDVGGGAGVHAFWLAQHGYSVHLIDAMPLHIEQAREGSGEFPGAQLAGADVGDARLLSQADDSVDAVLLLGPLYHLIDRADRLQALREAKRVVRPGGIVCAVGISRFASLMDGLHKGLLDDPVFQNIVRQDLIDGQHRNAPDRDYFTTTFFHHPDELRAEVAESGLDVLDLIGLNGLAFILPDFDAWWNDPARRATLLEFSRRIEREPALLGLHGHVMAIARNPA